MPSQPLFDRYRVVDIDTHVTEPADVWTERVERRFGERVLEGVPEGVVSKVLQDTATRLYGLA